MITTFAVDEESRMEMLRSVQKFIPILLEGIWLAGEDFGELSRAARRRSIALTSVTEEQSRDGGTSEPKPPSPAGRGGTGPSASFLGQSSISTDTLLPSGDSTELAEVLASGPVALPPKPEVILAQTLGCAPPSLPPSTRRENLTCLQPVSSVKDSWQGGRSASGSGACRRESSLRRVGARGLQREL